MNSTIKKILVPVDFTETSDIASSKAIEIAKHIKADIFLLHVVEFNGYYFSVVPEMKTIVPPIKTIEVEVKKKMDGIRYNIEKKSGVICKVFVSTGNICDEIIDFSKKKGIDLIVMGTHGASGYKELFIGSNAQRVVTLSNIPVLTMQKNGKTSDFKNILIPIDDSLHSREKINMAMVIAHIFNAKIHLLGLPNSKETKALDRFNVKIESVKKIINSEKLSSKITITHGDNIAKAALSYSKRNKCDLIVINTGHESKISGIFLNGFAQQIVNHAKPPVLSIKHTEGHFAITTPGYGID
ncbi:MAG: universal stress protein [Bacteroidetes bacterium]|nr:universal stress protein [Bacteroidota bacterium]